MLLLRALTFACLVAAVGCSAAPDHGTIEGAPDGLFLVKTAVANYDPTTPYAIIQLLSVPGGCNAINARLPPASSSLTLDVFNTAAGPIVGTYPISPIGSKPSASASFYKLSSSGATVDQWNAVGGSVDITLNTSDFLQGSFDIVTAQAGSEASDAGASDAGIPDAGTDHITGTFQALSCGQPSTAG
jgi:hypothetical protein